MWKQQSKITKITDHSVEIRVEHYTDKDCTTCKWYLNYEGKCDFLAGVCHPNKYEEIINV